MSFWINSLSAGIVLGTPLLSGGAVVGVPIFQKGTGYIATPTIAITDSGGIQEETTYLGIPCATLRENTERPITVTEGTNRLVKPADLPTAVREALAGRWPKGHCPQLWDGHAAERAAMSLKMFLSHRSGAELPRS